MVRDMHSELMTDMVVRRSCRFISFLTSDSEDTSLLQISFVNCGRFRSRYSEQPKRLMIISLRLWCPAYGAAIFPMSQI